MAEWWKTPAAVQPCPVAPKTASKGSKRPKNDTGQSTLFAFVKKDGGEQKRGEELEPDQAPPEEASPQHRSAAAVYDDIVAEAPATPFAGRGSVDPCSSEVNSAEKTSPDGAACASPETVVQVKMKCLARYSVVLAHTFFFR